MQEYSPTTPGQIPVEPDLRWIAELRDMISRCTDNLLLPTLQIKQGTTDVELHAYMTMTYHPSWELQKAIKSAAHSFARYYAKQFVLQSIGINPKTKLLHLNIYRKPVRQR